MRGYRASLKAAVHAAVVHSSTRYSWFGDLSEALPRAVRRALTPRSARAYLRYGLQSQLYEDYYCQGEAQAERRRDFGGAAPTDPTPFVDSLVAANTGDGFWAAGWEVLERGRDDVVLRREGLSLRARLEDCRDDGGAALAPGHLVSLRLPNGFLGISPGFYVALGSRELMEGGTAHVRWYWNLAASRAAGFLHDVTKSLNQAKLPYRLKVLQDPARFGRCDAVVLYCRKSDYRPVARLLGKIYPAVESGLQPITPALTKTLAPGVGLAEDPGGGESFGLHRCGLVAEGLIDSFEQGHESLEDRLAAVEARFREAGIDPEAPFLNAGSTDDYDLRAFTPRQDEMARAPRRDPKRPADPIDLRDTDGLLGTAVEIGDGLTRSAIWHGRRCTWIGAEPDLQHTGIGAQRMSCKTLAADVYGGTSGVAWFLAELYAKTEDAKTAETARGAMRQALSIADQLPPAVRYGLYAGWSGVALAGVRVGRRLDDEDLVDRARRLLRQLAREPFDGGELDVVAGPAGAILGYVALSDLLEEPEWLDTAVRAGDLLLEQADRSGPGYCWRSPSFPGQPGLNGFSHGAAGIGCALLQLFDATSDSRYRLGAEGAFDYERHWFDDETCNWPDLRTEFGQRRPSSAPQRFSNAWCHGAPGVALSRLSAYRVLGEARYRTEAAVALRTTSRAVEQSLRTKTDNYSLCHGLAGNADVLLHGSRVLGAEQREGALLVQRVAALGMERHRRNHDWPCGTIGETPGLMLGLAGIGYFYLRLCDAAFVSCLLIERESSGIGGCASASRETAT